jgi:hypothetical protein
MKGAPTCVMLLSVVRLITVSELNSFFSKFHLEAYLPFFFVKQLEQEVFSFTPACRRSLDK